CLAELGLLIWGEALFALLGLQAIQVYGWLLPITVFFLVAQQLAEQWLLRQQRFGLMAGIGVGQALVSGTGKSVMGLFYPFAWLLILLNTLSSVLYVVWVGLCLRRPGAWEDRPRHAVPSLCALARRYRDF